MKSDLGLAFSGWFLPYHEIATLIDTESEQVYLGLFSDWSEMHQPYLVMALFDSYTQVICCAVSYDQLAEIVSLYHEALHDRQPAAGYWAPHPLDEGQEARLVSWQVEVTSLMFRVDWTALVTRLFNPLSNQQPVSFPLLFEQAHEQVERFWSEVDDFLIRYRPANS